MKLACVNPSEGFKTLATNGLKQSNFLFKELFSNDYKKISNIDIFDNFRNFVSKFLSKDSQNLVIIRKENDTTFDNTVNYQIKSQYVQSYKI